MNSFYSSKIRTAILFLCVLSSILICVCGYVFGKKVPFANQWPLFEALRNTAAIIFAVIGAWMAIIYPERIRMSLVENGVRKPERTSANFRLLLTPAYHSTAILVILLLVGLIAPLVKPLPYAQLHVELFRGISYALLAALTCWQVAIVVLAMFPAETVQTAVDREAARDAIADARNKLRQLDSAVGHDRNG